MAHKVAEKLIILKDVGQGLMCRVHSLINFNKFVLESDPLVSSFSNLLIKKFPQMPPDIPGRPLKGYVEFKERSTEIKTNLEDSYRTFIDVVIYKKEAWEVLKECSKDILKLSYKTNNDLMSDFLSVLTQYVKLHILVTRVEDRKLMVCAYARAYHYSAGNTEPKYEDVANFFVEYDQKFLKKLQEDCAEISDCVGETLSEFWEPIQKWSNKDNLVKERVFSILETPETITRPQNEENHLLLMQYNDLCEWVLYGFLVCPLGLSKRAFPIVKKKKEENPLALQLLQKVLSNVFTVTVFRDVTLNIHKEYEVLFGYYQGPKPTNKKERRFKLSRYKSVLKEAKGDWKGCLKRHSELRTYLRVEMETLVHFFSEYPAVICPKFQMILALMNMSRNEILWYFLHHDKVVPWGLKARSYQHLKDPFIGALIYLTLTLIELVKKYRMEIQHFFMGYLMNTDVVHAKEIVDEFLQIKSLSSRDRELIRFLMDTLESGQASNFESVRLNWYRISASISNAHSGISHALKATEKISKIMTQIVHRSRNVDCLDTQLRTHGSFQQLYYYRGHAGQEEEEAGNKHHQNWSNMYTIYDCLKESIQPKNGSSPAYCLSLLKIFQSALHNVHRLCPEEHNLISKSIVKMGDGFLRYVVEKGIERPIKRIINGTSDYLRAQTREEKVIERMILAMEEVKEGEEKKTLPEPGWESHWSARNHPGAKTVDDMDYYRNFVAQVCGAFSQNEIMHIANVEFVPREYLIESASTNIDHYLRRYVLASATDSRKDRNGLEILSKDLLGLEFYINRPSVIVNRFKDVIYAYQLIEQHVGVNTGDIVRECLLRQFYDDTIGMCGESILSGRAEEKKDEGKQTKIKLIKYIANWYSTLFMQDIGVKFHLSYSPVYQAFFTNMIGNQKKHFHKLIDGTHYTDVNELNALCTLIGPYGVRSIDKALLGVIFSKVKEIKNIMIKYKKRFGQLKDQFTERPLWMDSKAELTATDPKQKHGPSPLDELVEHATTAGCAIIFRRLLKDALNRVCNKTVPFIHKAVKLAWNEAHSKITIDEKYTELAPLDYLAEDCGIDTNDYDHLLFDCLKQYKTQDNDRELWHLLPEAFGICYVCQRWRTAQYDVHSDSHNNNVRTMAECFYHLTLVFERITLKSESRQGATDPEVRIQRQLERFITNSSYSVLHMQNKESNNSRNPNLDHIMLFLEQFISVTNGRLKLSFLEECFPYTTLRENYIELFHKIHTKEMKHLDEQEEKKEEEKKDGENGEAKNGDNGDIKDGDNKGGSPKKTGEGNTTQ